jgi:hypothetical protein
MVKNSGGVAMLKDVADWRPPRRHDGVIILSPPADAIPPRLLGELPGTLAPASEAPLPSGSSGVRPGRGYDRGVMKLSDCAPWVPPKPERGLIIGNKWVSRDCSPVESAPPEDDGEAAVTSPKRRVRKR